MRKLFHFDSPTDRYRADVCIVSCFDARFELVTRKFLKKRGIGWADPLKIAGGAKAFSSPAEESIRTFALNQVRTSMQLHQTHRVMMMVHSDCGAYGGLQAFGGDDQRETENHESELRKAIEFLTNNITGIDVEGYYLKFNGVWGLCE